MISYVVFLGEKEGPIIDQTTGKVIGTHKGYWFHTIGQRKGLGLSQGPWFVVGKDMDQNIVYAANGYDPESQYGDQVTLQGMQFITQDPWGEICSGEEIRFKIRHTPDFTKGIIHKEGDKIYYPV